MSNWTETDTKNFLKLYERHENLWNPKNENYKCVPARIDSLKELVRDFNMSGFTLDDAKKRIQSLRDVYRRELKKIKFPRNSEVGKDHVYKPKIFWFDLADSFLRKLYEDAENEHTRVDGECSGLHDFETSEISLPQQSPPKQRSTLSPKLKLLKNTQPKLYRKVSNKANSIVTRSKVDNIENTNPQFKPTLNQFETADELSRNNSEVQSLQESILVGEGEDKVFEIINFDDNESEIVFSNWMSKTFNENVTSKKRNKKQSSEGMPKKQLKVDEICASGEIKQISSAPTPILDEHSLFGQTVAGHLRRLPAKIGLDCQAYIMQYIIQQRIRNLPGDITMDIVQHHCNTQLPVCNIQYLSILADDLGS